MEENNQKPQKYSLVTGQRIKNKSVRKLKKEHSALNKEKSKKQKLLSKRKQKFNKMLEKSQPVNAGESSELTQNTNQQAARSEERVLIVRRAEEGNPVSRKRKILNLFSYALVGFVAIFFGYFSGNLYIANKDKVDFGKFSEESLRDNGRAVYEAVISSGRTPDRCSASEVFVSAEYLLSQMENYDATVVGAIQPSIGKEQSVNGFKKKTGSLIEVESISLGMLPVAEIYQYDMQTRIAQIYKATKVDSAISATYPTTPTWVMNYDEFRAEYGSAPESPLVPYIISSKTIMSGTDSVKSIGGGRYQIKFNLTTDSAVFNYVKQVKHMSGLKDYPTFKAIVVTAVVDSDFNFVSLRFDEAYTVVYFGVMASCTGYLETKII